MADNNNDTGIWDGTFGDGIWDEIWEWEYKCLFNVYDFVNT
jgi:hypothetical protein